MFDRRLAPPPRTLALPILQESSPARPFVHRCWGLARGHDVRPECRRQGYRKGELKNSHGPLLRCRTASSQMKPLDSRTPRPLRQCTTRYCVVLPIQSTCCYTQPNRNLRSPMTMPSRASSLLPVINDYHSASLHSDPAREADTPRCEHAAQMGAWPQTASTLIRPLDRDRGFFLITICTSRSSAVRYVISRSTEKPSSL